MDSYEFVWICVDLCGFVWICVDFGGFFVPLGCYWKSSEIIRNHRTLYRITDELFAESPDFQNMPNIRKTPWDFLSISDFR